MKTVFLTSSDLVHMQLASAGYFVMPIIVTMAVAVNMNVAN